MKSVLLGLPGVKGQCIRIISRPQLSRGCSSSCKRQTSTLGRPSHRGHSQCVYYEIVHISHRVPSFFFFVRVQQVKPPDISPWPAPRSASSSLPSLRVSPQYPSLKHMWHILHDRARSERPRRCQLRSVFVADGRKGGRGGLFIKSNAAQQEAGHHIAPACGIINPH